MDADELDEIAMTMRARAFGVAIREAGERVARTAPPWLVLLDGPMGAGKTTFTRALARGLAVAQPDRVCSPTFTLCMVHPGPVTLVHVDLFRLADAEDEGMGGVAGFDALDLEEIAEDELQRGGGSGARVLVVEWAARWSQPPADHLAIRLALTPEGRTRSLHATARGSRSAELLAAWTRRLAGPFL